MDPENGLVMDQPTGDAQPADNRTAAELGRAFVEALDARDPYKLRDTLADYASFRALPHRDPVQPADEILDYFGLVVSSYPNARWDVTSTLSEGNRAVIFFTISEYDETNHNEIVSEQLIAVEAANGLLVNIVGYYDSREFERLFWADEL
jgi:hypothetical protein